MFLPNPWFFGGIFGIPSPSVRKDLGLGIPGRFKAGVGVGRRLGFGEAFLGLWMETSSLQALPFDHSRALLML